MTNSIDDVVDWAKEEIHDVDTSMTPCDYDGMLRQKELDGHRQAFVDLLAWLDVDWEHDPETCPWCERDRQAIEVKFDG